MSLRPSSKAKPTFAVAALAIGAMTALTGMSSDISGPEATSGTTSPTTTTIDRDAHSFGPQQPESVCKDDTLACAPAHTH